jgi:pimeloyl-ACP methyl ester carboxylesterase
LTALLLLACAACGCGDFAARRMIQAPNTYPKWLAPQAPVTLKFDQKLLRAFTNNYVQIASPAALIRYRIVEPADYEFRWTNHVDEARARFDSTFSANVDHPLERTNHWTYHPRGTVVLLHGYGVSSFVMLPWAFLLAEQGWRCVLVDLRGHGKSGGKEIYFGIQEARDLSALLDELHTAHGVPFPVSVVGHSFGAVVALRWKRVDGRVNKVVAISPYANLSRAILNVSRQYARWVPESFIKAGLRKLPKVLGCDPAELDPEGWMENAKETALFIAGGADKIAPPAQAQRLYQLADPGSELIVVPKAAHESLPFYFADLSAPIFYWLSGEGSVVVPVVPAYDQRASGNLATPARAP